jgi:hypothetical protein
MNKVLVRKIRGQTDKHNGEIDEINEKHKKVMLGERNKHSHLYSISSNFESIQVQSEQKQ